MKKKLKIAVLIIIGAVLVLIGTVFFLNLYNDKKYGKMEPSASVDVTDLSQYPKELDGVAVECVDAGAFQGFHLVPDEKKYSGVIICYGGSEGSPAFDIAEKYAEEGYETLAVFMFGMKNQPETLSQIPLEQFEDVLNYVNDNIEDDEPVTIWAASKGSEYALYLSTKYDEISNLILVAPSAYSFSGFDFNSPGASWTWGGNEVPCVDIFKTPLSVTFTKMIIPMIVGAPVSYKDIYDAALEADSQRAEKIIPVQDTDANILLIVGKDDQMWDSYEMAETIKGLNSNVTIQAYEDAGHVFRGNGVSNQSDMRIRLGGTEEGNKKAAEESEKAIDEFLGQYHNEKQE